MPNQVGDCFKFLWPFQNVRTLTYLGSFWPHCASLWHVRSQHSSAQLFGSFQTLQSERDKISSFDVCVCIEFVHCFHYWARPQALFYYYICSRSKLFREAIEKLPGNQRTFEMIFFFFSLSRFLLANASRFIFNGAKEV